MLEESGESDKYLHSPTKKTPQIGVFSQ